MCSLRCGLCEVFTTLPSVMTMSLICSEGGGALAAARLQRERGRGGGGGEMEGGRRGGGLRGRDGGGEEGRNQQWEEEDRWGRNEKVRMASTQVVIHEPCTPASAYLKTDGLTLLLSTWILLKAGDC